MARLREGRANTARGAAHFLRETVSRVRYGGASGQLTMRADSGRRGRRLPPDQCDPPAQKRGITPHVAQNTSGRSSAIDGRTTRRDREYAPGGRRGCSEPTREFPGAQEPGLSLKKSSDG